MNEVQKSEAVIADLETKRAACVKRGTELADERAAVALDAHTGNVKARKRLDEINAAIATHGSELASIDAAIKAAGERLQQAQASESQTQARKVARELLKRARVIVEHARTLDDANTIRVEASLMGSACSCRATTNFSPWARGRTTRRGCKRPLRARSLSTCRRAKGARIHRMPFRGATRSRRPLPRSWAKTNRRRQHNAQNSQKSSN